MLKSLPSLKYSYFDPTSPPLFLLLCGYCLLSKPDFWNRLPVFSLSLSLMSICFLTNCRLISVSFILLKLRLPRLLISVSGVHFLVYLKLSHCFVSLFAKPCCLRTTTGICQKCRYMTLTPGDSDLVGLTLGSGIYCFEVPQVVSLCSQV